ncbi:MAG: hypothetical protein ACIAQZ_09880 [Sedimentisphaeraceae bacterium JB056]
MKNMFRFVLLLCFVSVVTVTAAPFDWSTETVQDVAGKIEGSQNAIAVSPVGDEIVIGYSAISDATSRAAEGVSGDFDIMPGSIAALGNIRWIDVAVADPNIPWFVSTNTWSGGSVTVTSLDGVNLFSEVVATGTVYGSSIALDSNDNVAVSYGTTADGSCVKYAERVGAGSWTTDIIISGNGRYEDSQLAFDSSDVPYIAYRNDWSLENGATVMSLAFPDGEGGWTIEEVAADVLNAESDGSGGTDDEQYSSVISLDIDSSDRAVIAYSNTSGHVKVKVRNSDATYTEYTVTNSGIARSVSLKVVGDTAYIAYNNVSQGNLYLATGSLSTGNFYSETVVSLSEDGQNVQRFLDIDICSTGLPVISYFPINSPSIAMASATADRGLSCQDVIDMGARLPGDLSGDCYVGLSDFAILAANWLDCNEPSDLDCMVNW